MAPRKAGEERARLLRALEANEKLSLHLQIGFSLKSQFQRKSRFIGYLIDEITVETQAPIPNAV